MPIPHFTIKNKFQKRTELYKEILTDDILGDVCYKITRRRVFTVDFDDDGYNVGRLAVLEYKGIKNYISFSEYEIRSRNSYFQSFPSALVKFQKENNPRKRIYFYFLEPDGNIETDYFEFMYRLMKTAGTIFLNDTHYLSKSIVPFNSVSDIIIHRDANRQRNRGNASTYVTMDDNDILQIYGKTYGANKYETTLLCIALKKITTYAMELYEISEGNLKSLPKAARDTIISLGVNVIKSNLILERAEFENNNSLRSPRYIYNLLDKLGDKKCSLCECNIPQIIQGSHIWPVASIKRLNNVNIDDKIEFATDGDNGIWLCENHHKLFDNNILYIKSNGRLKYKINIEDSHEEYLKDFTSNLRLPVDIITPSFIRFLNKRNRQLDESLYRYF